MGKYDTSDVKSVQKFLVDMKGKFDAINEILPEDSEMKLDYDAFSEAFYKANEGILKNRDALKQEKLEISEQYDAFKAQMDEKWGSIDENIQQMYNDVVKERDDLKVFIKDGNVDLEDVNKKHASEIALLQSQFEEKMASSTKELLDTNNALIAERDAFKGNFFDVLKTNTLSAELDRIKVNPEDRQLIKDANLSRAQIAQDEKGNYNVVFANGEEQVPSAKFWDAWASDERNQRYILSEDNNGGGASGGTANQPVSEKAKLQKIANDHSLPMHEQIRAMEKLQKLN